MSSTGINLNFSDPNRDLEYPQIDDIKFANNDLILEYINRLPAPKNEEQISIFNRVFEEFHLRGGKA